MTRLNTNGPAKVHSRDCRTAGLRHAGLTVLLFVTAAAAAGDYVDGWGPAVGSRLPPLEAVDETGTVRTLEDLYGDQGLLLFLSRSADW